jgi:tRNA threonylcarbamoyladenosine biosynthesis protein TsaE
LTEKSKIKNQKSKIKNHLHGEFICKTPEDTFRLGFRFGETLRGGEIILLLGELGAGKTLFAKGIAESLDYDSDEVTSPSFTLVNIYDANLKIYHIDLYRLNEGASAAFAVDLDELLMDEEAVILIEWAERLANYPLPSPVFSISIKGDGDDPRTIEIESSELRL